ncbi:hypothetical protein [Sporolactobacillus terrae]|uniref:Uncharacterized protein n=1 Tax=Sporolactobacillus terrae TaxID=269673 RepID=A0ABX5Q738_9BACL|nr:hypothetical protein [Sporolactobacillus terrae]QAA22455.1 hypothetical protein C0674_07355 [Sporolactobacillus terrae]QAA25429.1 hypothetical protein C0679_07335 [Sporolactobacillus terrae]UAK17239.1 hypothetical protein K7399_04680 [Sporolactobacillus terrae]
MSFVSIIASNQWISVVSDGNQVEANDEGEIQISLSKKPNFVRISDYQFIACTGSEKRLKRIKRMFTFQDHPYAIDSAMLAQLKEEVTAVSSDRQDVLLAIADAAEGCVCRMISNKPGARWITIRPEHGRAATLFLAGKGIDEQKIRFLSDECNRLLRHKEEKLDNAIIVQVQLNRIAATLDSTIGSRIFRLTIKAP